MLKRNLINRKGEVIGIYYVDEKEERKIFDIDGNKIDLSKVSAEEENYIRGRIDAFEEGFNQVVDGFEQLGVIGVTAVTIKRKVSRIEFNHFEHN